jgi:protein SCO1/2
MNRPARAWAAVAALAVIVAVTASWWTLALWPLRADAPEWVVRTRDVCFGAGPATLPDGAGWLVLVGQPIGMIALLLAVGGADLRTGLGLLMARVTGQLAAGAVLALVVAGLAAAAVRVRTASVDVLAAGTIDAADHLTRVDDAAPAFSLIDQSGRTVRLESFRGRPVIVTFAFAHCATVCPLAVADVLAARRLLEEPTPAALVITLDPWRDTPARLPSIAESWNLGPDAHVLSGSPADVERALNAWRVPRTRNQRTGDLVHPRIVYVIGANGRIAYVVNGGADTIAAAVRALG